MRRASVFVFPSRYEGFGLPPLEAMRLGVPTIVSTAGSLPEVCGDGAIALDPDDAQGLATTLLRLVRSASQRAALSEAGRRQAAGFTWERCARETRAVYQRALNG
jgi:glycosyltransferase involved in cell wall biosynthesis